MVKFIHANAVTCLSRYRSNLLSMIEYVTKPVLTDIMKCHNMQFPLKTNQEVLCTLIACHLSYGDCANSEAFSAFGSPSKEARYM